MSSSSTLRSLLGDELKNCSGGTVCTDTLENCDVIGIYFSASWCPPCRGFTPVLVKCYNNVNAKGKRFEVVFVSLDRDKKSFDDYFSEKPWLTIGFNSNLKDYLKERYKVNGIPALMLVDSRGDLITTDGRTKVSNDPEGDNFPWSSAKTK